MMIRDARLSLAFSMQRSKGAYALLLGSGISRSAGVLTGWEIVIDLLKQVAAVEGVTYSDPVAWYRNQYGTEPDYSQLIDLLAPMQAERTQLLRSYFEPSAEESDQGLKAATPAHHAIAALVEGGYIRVIITTNFDRLLEQALAARRIEPTVIATPDDLDNAMPYVHARCTLLKVHGDYIGTRLKNTTAELAAYDPKFDALLDRICEDFGLIVCGWSATYDPALAQALKRHRSAHFATYWTVRDSVTPEAQSIIDMRTAHEIEISGADEFFVDLEEKVTALEETMNEQQLSAAAARATLQRRLDESHDARAHDLVVRETERLRDWLAEDLTANSVISTDAAILERLTAYDQAASVIVALMSTGCYWGAGKQNPTWRYCVERLADLPVRPPQNVARVLAYYPSLLAAYAGGMAAMLAGKYDVFRPMLVEAQAYHLGRGEELPFIRAINAELPMNLVSDIVAAFMRAYNRCPYISAHLHDVLREPLREFTALHTGYDAAFARFECLLGLIATDISIRLGFNPWGPRGFNSWERNLSTYPMLEEMAAQANAAGPEWPPLAAGLFDRDTARLTAAIDGYRQRLRLSAE